MRQIEYKKRQSLKHRRKMIAITERAEDKDCRTHVRKSFVYVVRRVDHIEHTPDPEIYIQKQLDTKLNIERFCFRVKGSFYMTRERHTFKVEFCHTLKINIVWKKINFSPKKSVTLT